MRLYVLALAVGVALIAAAGNPRAGESTEEKRGSALKGDIDPQKHASEATGRELLDLTNVSPAGMRSWTDVSGTYQTEAVYLNLVDGKVLLRKASGSEIMVPLESLSAADRDYVNSRVRGENLGRGNTASRIVADAEVAHPMATGQPDVPTEARVTDPILPAPKPRSSLPSESDSMSSTDLQDTSRSSSGMMIWILAGSIAAALLVGAGFAVMRFLRTRAGHRLRWSFDAFRQSLSMRFRGERTTRSPLGAQTRCTPDPEALMGRARAVSAYDQVNEQDLARDESYRATKIAEFAEIVDVAKEACQAAGRTASVSELDYIVTRGTLLFAAWGEIRPRLEATPAALFACSAMIVFCWSTPQSAIRQFALHEAKPGDTPETTAQLISTTATSLEKIMSQMGLG